MAEIIIVGLGPGPLELLTREARKVLEEAPRVFFRYATDPVAQSLIAHGKDIVSFERLYANPSLTYLAIYKLIVKAIIHEAKLRGTAVFALPGNPYVFEKTPRWIEEYIKRHGEDIKVSIVAGMSFLDLIYPTLGIDPEEGIVILNASRMAEVPEFYAPVPRLGCLIGQLGLPLGDKSTGAKTNFDIVLEVLRENYPDDHPAVLVFSKGYPDFTTDKIHTTIKGLTTYSESINNLTSLYIPPLSV